MGTRNNKKYQIININGFTLIEILAVIIIIGIIAIIAIPSISKYLNSSKDTVYTSYEKSMVDAAKNRVVECITENLDCELPSSEEEQKMYLDTLINGGYLDNMKDPDTKEFCEVAKSYVEIKGDQAGSYKYQACLRCGDYFTDNAICSDVETGYDNDDPVCGEKTGESTRWTNQNRTVSVGCTDLSSGCVQSVFSKTFSKTTKDGVGEIVIRDKSGRPKTCTVNAYVDKGLPTCEINVIPAESGEFIENVGWYSLKATAGIQNMRDGDGESGLLTYGMGTSLKNREYNQKDKMEVGKGITTVIGYTKDKAGNEGTCGKEIRVGTEQPKFNVLYGYQIFPNKDEYTSSGVTISGGTVITTSTVPVINFTGLSKYKSLKKVRIFLNSAIGETTTGYLTIGGKTYNGLMQKGTTEIQFVLKDEDVKAYETASIQLGSLLGQTYMINRIEFVTLDGSTWTNKDVSIYVEPIDEGMQTTEISFDSGLTWGTTFTRRYTSYYSSTIITKNSIEMQSKPYTLEVLIDKNPPTGSLVATKVTSKTQVASNNWANEALEFKVSPNVVNLSNQYVYYCVDTNNTCTPNIQAEPNQLITALNTRTTNYYFRYKIVNEIGVECDVISYTAKFDVTKPVCEITNHATLSCTDQGSANQVSGIVAWHYDKENNPAGTYTTIATTNSMNLVASSKVTSIGTYYLYVKDVAGNISEVKNTTYYLVTYDKNGGSTNPTKLTDIVREENNADLTPSVSKTGFAFAGWHTDPSAPIGYTTYQVNNSVTLYAIWLDLWASNLSYDDSGTNLGCADVQCALDKISEKLK